MHWRWSRPGELLVVEYIAPASGRITHTNTNDTVGLKFYRKVVTGIAAAP